MSDLIDLLQRRQLIWHGRDCQPAPEVLSSGYALFDEKLAGGFPKTGVVSINTPLGIGELRFLSSSLLAETSASSHSSNRSRLLVFIHPPGVLSAEFFHHQGFDLNNILVIYPRHKNEALWAAEQCLKSGACRAVLLWQDAFATHQIKRLQIASDEGSCLQFLMRSKAKKSVSLPVSLSMQLAPHAQGLEVSINKRKGGWELPQFTLDMSPFWPALSFDESASRSARANNVIPFSSKKQQRL